ncbi:hypothetical protein A0J61_10862 [Choanephora cucurbitarum]|uniref:Uncharacterized protein n=1 Tax=Choanephora cucurbitarum TaxID=101091 RepID=A0A1C7MXE7_9FUNG|nr:hypothetical protein A0J61_10862 [Choanephora cucurbitarum]
MAEVPATNNISSPLVAPSPAANTVSNSGDSTSSFAANITEQTVSSANVTNEPVELDWVPGAAMTEFQKAALGFMRLMEESRTSRQSQRDIVNYLNNNFFVRFGVQAGKLTSRQNMMYVQMGATCIQLTWLISRNVTLMVVAKELTELQADDDTLNLLSYGHDFLTSDYETSSEYKDIFSSLLFVNGYQNKNSQKSHQVMINCLIMNIHPQHQRVIDKTVNIIARNAYPIYIEITEPKMNT